MTDTTLRLVWPHRYGAGTSAIEGLAPEFTVDETREGYALGSRILDAALPSTADVTATVPAAPATDAGTITGGIEARATVLAELESAVATIDAHEPARILTLGGDCAVSVAPFASLAARYGDDLAVVWVDSHPDADTPDTAYEGYHAMAAALITGHGDEEILAKLPATVEPSRLCYAGLHDGEPDALENVRAWGHTVLDPDQLRADSSALLEWLAATGCSKVAIHLDVDVVDADEITLGLGMVPNGLRTADVHRLIADLGAHADVVALTVAEFLPRRLMRLAGMLRGLPLI